VSGGGFESHRLVVRKRFSVPREELFSAWTDAETMALWMCPGDIVSAEVRMDLRVGGSLLIVMRDSAGTYEHHGRFTIIDPPSKLAFTWIAAATDMQETLVTVEFFALSETESELVLTHDRFPRPDVRDRYRGGWDSILHRLAVSLRPGA